MLINLLKKANQLSWQLSASLDVSAKFHHQENGPDYPIDVHSWFFCKKISDASEDFSNLQVLFVKHRSCLKIWPNVSLLAHNIEPSHVIYHTKFA